MRRIPWRLSLRYSRKGAMTVAGIALGVAFALVSFSIASGLERDTLGIARNHPDTALVIVAESGEPFPIEALAAHPRALGLVFGEATDNGGDLRVAVALVGPDAPRLEAGTAHPGVVDAPVSSIEIAGETLAVGSPARHPLVAPGWFLVPPALLTDDASRVEFAVLLDATGDEVAAIRAAGFVTHGAPALEIFFQASGVEIARDLILVVAFSSLLAIVFCYEFLRSEVRESQREIGIWRAVGMRAKDVVALFLARAGAIGILALVAGWGLSAMLLGLVHGRTGVETLRFHLAPLEAVVISAAFLLATVLGGAVPAFVAGRVRVQAALGGAP